MLYSTTACQSRCKHCNIWQKQVEHLSLEDIKRIMQSKCITKRTTVGLEGGEFILHPQAEEIMAWFRKHHPNFTLLSNCLSPVGLLMPSATISRDICMFLSSRSVTTIIIPRSIPLHYLST